MMELNKQGAAGPESVSLRESTERFRMIATLNELHAKYKHCQDGRVADYIPELAKVDPDHFGICVVSVDGQVYEVGDYDQRFTIQSASKPFAYGLVLDHCGRDFARGRVNVEPTGDAFNSVIKLDERSKRPHNPMVNAGAIAMTSLVPGDGPTERLNTLLDMFRRYVARDVFVDISVFMSERTTGDRNRALAYLMRNFGMIEGTIDEALDLYFQQCALVVTARDLALMAATLANEGVNPVSGERAIGADHVRDVLSVMFTCGLYDYAGEWAYEVGLPAKSGVGGGILMVVPGSYGVAVFSPPLDARGNSVRGIHVCRDLSQLFGLHVFGRRRFIDAPSAEGAADPRQVEQLARRDVARLAHEGAPEPRVQELAPSQQAVGARGER